MNLAEFRNALIALLWQTNDIPKADILAELEMQRDIILHDLPDDDEPE
jgi:hypothetical protein